LLPIAAGNEQVVGIHHNRCHFASADLLRDGGNRHLAQLIAVAAIEHDIEETCERDYEQQIHESAAKSF
jgi:hypothetical protein